MSFTILFSSNFLILLLLFFTNLYYLLTKNTQINKIYYRYKFIKEYHSILLYLLNSIVNYNKHLNVDKHRLIATTILQNKSDKYSRFYFKDKYEEIVENITGFDILEINIKNNKLNFYTFTFEYLFFTYKVENKRFVPFYNSVLFCKNYPNLSQKMITHSINLNKRSYLIKQITNLPSDVIDYIINIY
jgi:hypothetical protein